MAMAFLVGPGPVWGPVMSGARPGSALFNPVAEMPVLSCPSRLRGGLIFIKDKI